MLVRNKKRSGALPAASPPRHFNLGLAAPLAVRHHHAPQTTRMEGPGLLEGLIEAFACSVAELRSATLLRVDGEFRIGVECVDSRPSPSCAQLLRPAARLPLPPPLAASHHPRCRPSLPRHDAGAVCSGRGGH